MLIQPPEMSRPAGPKTIRGATHDMTVNLIRGTDGCRICVVD